MDLYMCSELRDVSPLAALSGLVSLRLPPPVSDGDLALIAARMPGLRSLGLGGCRALTGLAPLGGLTKLAALDLSYCVGVKDLSALADLRGLVRLKLDGCRGVTDIAPLSSLTGLRALGLRGCSGVADLGPISGLRGLRSLSLPGVMSDAALERVVRDHPELVSLDLGAGARVNDLRPLARLPALAELNLMMCEGVLDLSQLEPLAGLRFVNLSGCTSLRGAESLAKLPSLRTLILVGAKGVEPWQAERIRRELPDCRVFLSQSAETADAFEEWGAEEEEGLEIF